MPRDSPHPLALFSLFPLNERARAMVKHPDNAHLLSTMPMQNGKREVVIDVGFNIGSKSRYTLATIGRYGDIVIEGPGISRIQCSFEVHEKNPKEYMLQDRSSNHTTQLIGEAAVSFEAGRAPRRVVVDPQLNLVFGFGGTACDLYTFRIIWHVRDDLDLNQLLDNRENHPRLARTLLEEGPPTEAPSGRATRIHTPASKPGEQIRYSIRKRLGGGAFGEVYRVINVDTGNLLAMKTVARPSMHSHEYIMLKREVETLSRMSHRHIVQYLDARWEGQNLLIFMNLKPGNVEDLAKQNLFVNDSSLSKPLLHQMLQALDYLSHHGIVHRDVKPENILYDLPQDPEGDYEYQLADFGLANLAAEARTYAGTAIFMAPELERNVEGTQSSKMDVWSLFVTLAYVLDADSFRRKPLHTSALRVKAVREAANKPPLWELQDMAVVDPELRASAADVLDQYFSGEGRTTPRDQIAHLASPAQERLASAGPGIESPADRGQRRGRLQREPAGAGAAAAIKKKRTTRLVNRTANQFAAAAAASEKVSPAVQKRRTRDDVLRVPGAFPRDRNFYVD